VQAGERELPDPGTARRDLDQLRARADAGDEDAAAQQAPDPGLLAGQATTAHAETRARVVRARQRYELVQALKAAGKNVTTVMRELRLAPGTALLPRGQRR
jgi:hypothetical protein